MKVTRLTAGDQKAADYGVCRVYRDQCEGHPGRGLGRQKQVFNATAASAQSGMLLLALAALAMPAVYELVVGSGLPPPGAEAVTMVRASLAQPASAASGRNAGAMSNSALRQRNGHMALLTCERD